MRNKNAAGRLPPGTEGAQVFAIPDRGCKGTPASYCKADRTEKG